MKSLYRKFQMNDFLRILEIFLIFLSNLNFVLVCFHNEIVFPQNATIV